VHLCVRSVSVLFRKCDEMFELFAGSRFIVVNIHISDFSKTIVAYHRNLAIPNAIVNVMNFSRQTELEREGERERKKEWTGRNKKNYRKDKNEPSDRIPFACSGISSSLPEFGRGSSVACFRSDCGV